MCMNKEKSVIEFYVLCNKLKDVIRTGWKDWGVKRFRVESVAEHIYGVQMLAISMWSQFGYEIDIKKVITMLAVHELEEVIIGDLTQFQIDKASKDKLGHEAINKMLSGLVSGEEIERLILEFDERATSEAKFAYQCDKLECDIQCKLYDEEKCVNLSMQENNTTARDESVQKLLREGKSWSEMWLRFGQDRYPYDDNFLAVSNYVIDNDISIKPDK